MAVASLAVLQDSPEVVAARQAWREKESKRQAAPAMKPAMPGAEDVQYSI